MLPVVSAVQKQSVPYARTIIISSTYVRLYHVIDSSIMLCSFVSFGYGVLLPVMSYQYQLVLPDSYPNVLVAMTQL